MLRFQLALLLLLLVAWGIFGLYPVGDFLLDKMYFTKIIAAQPTKRLTCPAKTGIMPLLAREWRNRQTRTFEGRVGNSRTGSSPVSRTMQKALKHLCFKAFSLFLRTYYTLNYTQQLFYTLSISHRLNKLLHAVGAVPLHFLRNMAVCVQDKGGGMVPEVSLREPILKNLRNLPCEFVVNRNISGLLTVVLHGQLAYFNEVY